MTQVLALEPWPRPASLEQQKVGGAVERRSRGICSRLSIYSVLYCIYIYKCLQLCPVWTPSQSICGLYGYPKLLCFSGFLNYGLRLSSSTSCAPRVWVTSGPATSPSPVASARPTTPMIAQPRPGRRRKRLDAGRVVKARLHGLFVI